MIIGRLQFTIRIVVVCSNNLAIVVVGGAGGDIKSRTTCNSLAQWMITMNRLRFAIAACWCIAGDHYHFESRIADSRPRFGRPNGRYESSISSNAALGWRFCENICTKSSGCARVATHRLFRLCETRTQTQRRNAHYATFVCSIHSFIRSLISWTEYN